MATAAQLLAPYEPIRFEVIGVPKAQGSKKAYVIPGKNGAKGRAAMKDDAGAAGAAWRDAVAHTARDVARHADVASPLDGPLTLEVTFRFPMPASRSKADRLRGWIPKTTAPDTSKLVRSLEDGLQAGGLIKDDARFWNQWARKIEIAEGWTGAEIVIRREDA